MKIFSYRGYTIYLYKYDNPNGVYVLYHPLGHVIKGADGLDFVSKEVAEWHIDSLLGPAEPKPLYLPSGWYIT